jgi:hypothetical protein
VITSFPAAHCLLYESQVVTKSIRFFLPLTCPLCPSSVPLFICNYSTLLFVYYMILRRHKPFGCNMPDMLSKCCLCNVLLSGGGFDCMWCNLDFKICELPYIETNVSHSVLPRMRKNKQTHKCEHSNHIQRF